MALVVKKVNGHGPAAAAAPAPAPESLAALQVKAAGVTVDALPYIDTEIDQPGVREAVNKLVAAELAAMGPNTGANISALAFAPLKFKSALLNSEMERVEKGETLPPLDTVRYQLEEPAGSKKNNVADWEESLHNSQAQLQHQNLRLANLDLLQKYGANAWRVHNYQLEQMHKGLQGDLQSAQGQITELNRKRKLEQTQASSVLTSLDAQYYELTNKNVQIEAACKAMDAHLAPLRPEVKQQTDYHAHHFAQDEAKGSSSSSSKASAAADHDAMDV